MTTEGRNVFNLGILVVTNNTRMKLISMLRFYNKLEKLSLRVLFAELMLCWNILHEANSIFKYRTCHWISLFKIKSLDWVIEIWIRMRPCSCISTDQIAPMSNVVKHKFKIILFNYIFIAYTDSNPL